MTYPTPWVPAQHRASSPQRAKHKPVVSRNKVRELRGQNLNSFPEPSAISAFCRKHSATHSSPPQHLAVMTAVATGHREPADITSTALDPSFQAARR
jgi:hypothetical protein